MKGSFYIGKAQEKARNNDHGAALQSVGKETCWWMVEIHRDVANHYYYYRRCEK